MAMGGQILKMRKSGDRKTTMIAQLRDDGDSNQAVSSGPVGSGELLGIFHWKCLFTGASVEADARWGKLAGSHLGIFTVSATICMGQHLPCVARESQPSLTEDST